MTGTTDRHNSKRQKIHFQDVAILIKLRSSPKPSQVVNVLLFWKCNTRSMSVFANLKIEENEAKMWQWYSELAGLENIYRIYIFYFLLGSLWFCFMCWVVGRHHSTPYWAAATYSCVIFSLKRVLFGQLHLPYNYMITSNQKPAITHSCLKPMQRNGFTANKLHFSLKSFPPPKKKKTPLLLPFHFHWLRPYWFPCSSAHRWPIKEGDSLRGAMVILGDTQKIPEGAPNCLIQRWC